MKPYSKEDQESRNDFENFLQDNLEAIALEKSEYQDIAEKRLNAILLSFPCYDTLFSSMILLAKSKPYHQYWEILGLKVLQAGAICIEQYEEAAKLRDEINGKIRKYAEEMFSLSRV